jgi:glutamate formiminotransferase/glutamate formiminotransferase/formiminotetrahydrofolate cyclodeaminase
MVVQAVRAHAQVSSAELVGLAPAVAFDGFPHDVPIPRFDPARHLIENALRC